jgi:ribosomal protein S18 acetylase RimI-like enzyme
VSAQIVIAAVKSEAHLEQVRALAHEIWREHYPGIITPEQVEYMLEQQYSIDTLRNEFLECGVRYDRALFREVLVGYSAYEPLDLSNAVKLRSLYVKASARRSGCGRALLDRVVEYGKQSQFSKLVLTVNRKNATAIRAYHRFGFCVRGPIVTNIGRGYIMDDHLMELDLGAS